MYRTSRHDPMPIIRSRFANRALREDPIPDAAMDALLEAASFAPSCFNEQPWRFLVAVGERKEKLLATLTVKNQSWAHRAPVLVLVAAKQTYTQGGKPNFWHQYDVGCACGFLILEAEHRGIIAHPMAGFDRAAAAEAFDLPHDLTVITVIAIGYPGDENALLEADRERNHPKPRKPIEELLLKSDNQATHT